MEKQTFGQRIPSLHEMIPHIGAAIDHRFLIRRNLVGNKRIKYYHKDPLLQEALDTASWILNPIGIKLFFENIKISEKRSDYMAIKDEGDGVNETFGAQEKNYTCDGTSCSCSYYHQMFLCRHIIFFRKTTGMSVFDEGIFHPSLMKNASIDRDAPIHALDDELFGETPTSPGMEMILSEQKRTRKTPTQSKKFNTGLDVGRELAEIICTYDMETYLEVLEMSKNFVKQVRKGVNSKLRDYLKSPGTFAIVPDPVSQSDGGLVEVGAEEAVGPMAGDEIVNIAEFMLDDNVFHDGEIISPPRLANSQSQRLNYESSSVFEPEEVVMGERGTGIKVKVISKRLIGKESQKDKTSYSKGGREDRIKMTNTRLDIRSQVEMSEPSENLIAASNDGMDHVNQIADLSQTSLASLSQISASSSSAVLGNLVAIPSTKASHARDNVDNLTDDELRKSPEKGNLISYMKKLETVNHGNVDNQLRAGIRQFENRSEMGDEDGEGSSGRTWSPVRRIGRRLCGSDMDTSSRAERNDSQEGNIFSFSGDADELPEPDYTPQSFSQ